MNQFGSLSTRLLVGALLGARLGAATAECAIAGGAADPAFVAATPHHLYVAPHGMDSYPGTAEEPFRTIERAAQAAAPGTTVHVATGTYPAGFRTTASGTETDRISFVASTRWGAKLVPPENSRTDSAWDNRGNFVDIDGFEVDGSAHAGGTMWTMGIYSAGSYDSIRNNHVHDVATTVRCTNIGGAGIDVDGYYRGVGSEVVGNTVHDVGRNGCRFIQGIYISTSAVVTDNIAYRIGYAAIHLWHDARDVVVGNNTVTGSNVGILVGGGDFRFTRGPNDHTHVYNNIVYDNRYGVVEDGATGKHNTYQNNLVFRNKVNWRLRNGLVHRGTVAADPEFVAYARAGTPDFRLRGTSPALGRGIAAASAATSDITSGARMAHAACDIGARQR